MKRLLLVALALLFFGGAVGEAKAAGMPMMKGIKDVNELADLVDDSLRRDPQGHALLSPAKCKKDGSCASAFDYYRSIQELHPASKLTDIAMLSSYLRSLEKRPAPKDGKKWTMTRIIVGNGTHTLDIAGWERAFSPGESVWVDVNTGEMILAGDCGNVIGQTFEVEVTASVPRCVEVPFEAPVGTLVRWGIGSTTGPLPPSNCNAQKEGDGDWRAWYGECDICVPAIGYIRQRMGGAATIPHRYLYKTTAEKQVIRFSTAVWETTFYICLEYPNGTQTCGVYIHPGSGQGDWRQRYSVPILNEFWRPDDGRCPR